MNKRLHIRQLLHLTLAHLKEVTRQPAVLFWGIIFPIVLSIGLGLAFTRDAVTVHHIGLTGGPENNVRSPFGTGAAILQETLAAHGYTLNIVNKDTFELMVPDKTLGDTRYVFEADTWNKSIVRLKQGRISLIMTMTEDGAQYHFDPTNPEARLAWQTLSLLVATGDPSPRAQLEIDDTERKAEKGVIPLELPGTRYIDFLIPGLIAMTVMMSCMWGISYGMIDKRSKKLLRRMVATPMVKSHFLAALMLVRIFINIVEAALLGFFAWLLFDVAIQGSPWALGTIFLAGNIAFCGIAVFVSSRTANTEVGNGMINAVVMPMTLLSGVFFSYHNFPEWSIPVIEKLPLTLLVDGIRAVFSEGAGFVETAPASGLLLLIGIAFFTAGLNIFKWH